MSYKECHICEEIIPDDTPFLSVSVRPEHFAPDWTELYCHEECIPPTVEVDSTRFAAIAFTGPSPFGRVGRRARAA